MVCGAYYSEFGIHLMHGHAKQLPGSLTSTNTINLCLILSTIYIFIPVSGCVGRDSSALLCPGAYNAAKTALHLRLVWL
jgi:hypothetical protein